MEATMRCENISPSESLKILSNAAEMGSYNIPHVIDELDLRGSEKSFMVALFKIQHMYCQKSRDYQRWFFATNKMIMKYAKRSESSIKKARRRCNYRGLIDYRSGSGLLGRATEYRVLIDDFYLADQMIAERGQKKRNTKATEALSTRKEEGIKE